MSTAPMASRPPTLLRPRVSMAARVASAALLVLSSVLALTPDRAVAQVPRPSLQISLVEHDPAGSLTVGIRADVGRATQVESLTVFVDDMPVTLDLARRAVRADLALMLLVDVSGSMDGVPLTAAREAARQLITRLPAGDRVGLVSFASAPAVRAPLTADRARVVGALDGLQAEGATALFQAVTAASAQFAGARETEQVIVLLSDGQDSGAPDGGGPAAADRASSIGRAKESGAAVYTVGVGPDYDEAYLAELAAATGGRFFTVRDAGDVSAVSHLFSQLGDRFAANETYTIPMTALAQGAHRLEVRGRVSGATASASATFEVTNAGLLRPSVGYPPQPGEPISLQLGPVVERQDLALQASVQGRTFVREGSAPSIAIDPWLLQPGAHDVELTALVRGAVAARETVRVEVPALAPAITLGARGDSIVVRGTVQGGRAPTLVARNGSREVTRGTSELTLAAGTRATVVELLDASGEPLLTREIEHAPAGTPRNVPWLLALPAAGALVVPCGWLLLRRRRRATAASEPLLLRRMAKHAGQTAQPWGATAAAETGQASAAAPAQDRGACFGTLVVHDQAGRAREIHLTHRPITVGSAPGCGVVLDDPAIRAEHIRLSALSPEEVQVHVLREDTARPYIEHEDDEWLIIRSGEQLILGPYRLQVLLGPPRAREGEDGGTAVPAVASSEDSV